MLPSHSRELTAIAFQLLATLDDYEGAVDVLEAGWDSAVYSDSSEQFDRMRLYASVLPRIQVAWIEVLISRFEMLEVLWDRRGQRGPEALAELHGQHKASIERLRRQCIARYASTSDDKLRQH